MNILKIFRFDRKLINFLLWVSFGLGFSMSVILSTIGLMEGFEKDLLTALNKSNGDFSISKELTNEDLGDITLRLSEKYPTITSTGYYKSEAFLVGSDRQSKGVIMLAGEFNNNSSFNFFYNKEMNLKKGDAYIGEDLAEELGIKQGDSFRSLISSKEGSALVIKNFVVKGFFKTNLYEKDSRLAIVSIADFFSEKDILYNHSIFSFNYPYLPFEQQKDRLFALNELLFNIDKELYATPYWDDYSTLIEAVEIEKVSILIVLQVIVLVSVFNLLSFLIFFREKKIKELFTLHAIGLTPKKINQVWYYLSTYLWVSSVMLSVILVAIFGKVLEFISSQMMPKNIYHLGEINIYLSFENYIIVYVISLCWILLMTFALTRKFKSDSLLRGLRQQYS